MTIEVTEEHRRTYERDGVVLLRNVISERWIETLRAGVDKVLVNPSLIYEEYDPEAHKEGDGRFVNAINLSRNVPEFKEFIEDGPCPEMVANIMGSRQINLFHDQMLIKEAGTRRFTYWHQDDVVFAIDGRQFGSTWIPLDPVTKDNRVEFVRGSHLWNVTYAYFDPLGDDPESCASNNPPLPDVENHRESFDIVSWDTEPGDVLVFGAKMLHQGRSEVPKDARRRILTFRWGGDDATYSVRTPPAEYPLVPPEGVEHGVPMRNYEEDFPKVWPQG